MTDDERLLVEWVIWNVRVCDLPADVAAAAARLDASGAFPRPAAPGGYEPVVAKVTAFPRDESLPLRDRLVTRAHVGSVVDDVYRDDVAYVLVCGVEPSTSEF